MFLFMFLKQSTANFHLKELEAYERELLSDSDVRRELAKVRI